MLGLAWIGPSLWYGAEGRAMFFGYYLILAFPLLVIVPFGGLRSLAGEYEEHTYELLSITTLGPRQIISGKLGSSILQMIVYLSAISPCLAFTYMLRGIDVPTILFVLFYTVLASLGLSVIGLLVGTLSTAKHWQVVLSVLAVLGLFFAFFFACVHLPAMLLSTEVPFAEAGFWQGMAIVLTFYASYFALVFLAAAARLTFASDNRSTRLRIVMLLQQLLFTGWMTWAFAARPEGARSLAGLYHLGGAALVRDGHADDGESPDLSAPRETQPTAELSGPGNVHLVQSGPRNRLPVCPGQLCRGARAGPGCRRGCWPT